MITFDLIGMLVTEKDVELAEEYKLESFYLKGNLINDTDIGLIN